MNNEYYPWGGEFTVCKPDGCVAVVLLNVNYIPPENVAIYGPLKTENIGVEKIVVGSVDKVGQIYSIDVRMVDVNTGKIEKVATKECESCTIGDILKTTISDVAKILSGTTSSEEPKEPAPDERRRVEKRSTKKQKPKKNKRDKSIDTASIGKAYFLIDPLGFVVFGPTIEAGVRIARNTTLGLNVRFLKLGYISSLVISDATKLGSVSPGLRLDHFFGRKSSRSKFYAGIGSQLQLIFYEDPDSQGTEGNLGAIVIMAGFGHRWRGRNGLFLNLGLYFAIGFEVWDKYWYKDNPSDVKRGDFNILPGGGIELSFGKEF